MPTKSQVRQLALLKPSEVRLTRPARWWAVKITQYADGAVECEGQVSQPGHPYPVRESLSAPEHFGGFTVAAAQAIAAAALEWYERSNNWDEPPF
jgi:hypothetical protein